jgi:glycosyltransferase involved in cell wall biosynthesis
MRCPCLQDLPAAPSGLLGWPWTEGGQPLPDAMPDGQPWARISIVTPSFNQGQFIEQTIRSVLLQGYPDIEYFIIDGGSTDQTLDIIRKYEPWLTGWVSEPDRGQSHAINKGLAQTTGEVFAWLNSDDYYEPLALFRAAGAMRDECDAAVWTGTTRAINKNGEFLYLIHPQWGDKQQLGDWGASTMVPQPSSFYKASAVRQVGGLNEALHYAMDVELLLKLADEGRGAVIRESLASFRVYPEAKTSQDHTGPLAEIIASDVNLGMRQVAQRVLKRYMNAARRGGLDDPTDDEIRLLLDRTPYRALVSFTARRLCRSLGLRCRRILQPFLRSGRKPS